MISITLPSLSEEAVRRAVRNLEETTSTECEIIVISPGQPRLSSRFAASWIEDQVPAGANAAHELGFRAARGDHVFAWVDDHVLHPGWDEAAMATLADLRSVSGGRPVAAGLRHVSGQTGTCFGLYYPYFPVMSREDVIKVGGWLSGEYRLGFADVDLGLRVWHAGGRCGWTDRGVVEKLSDDDRKLGNLHQGAHTTQDDLALFLDRWSKTLGAGWPVGNLRDFNIDRILAR